jgi:hypothetical protein
MYYKSLKALLDKDLGKCYKGIVNNKKRSYSNNFPLFMKKDLLNFVDYQDGLDSSTAISSVVAPSHIKQAIREKQDDPL